MTKTEAVVRSVKDGTTLTFRLSSEATPDRDQTTFDVALEGPEIRARSIASTYYAGSPALLFRSIAQRWKGWDGDVKWSTLEGEVALAARTDPLGHVTLEVSLRSDTYPPDWRVTALLHLEAGSLDAIWKSVAAVLPIAEGAQFEG